MHSRADSYVEGPMSCLQTFFRSQDRMKVSGLDEASSPSMASLGKDTTSK